MKIGDTIANVTTIHRRPNSTFMNIWELDYCYRIFRGERNIGTAKSYCNSVGGQLSAINSPEKQDFLEHVMVGRPHDPVLIDGEKQPDDTWRQEDGSLLTYSNWYPNEPNGDGNCIQLCTGDKWCDVRCRFVQDVLYMCEE
ncbi:pulmonary surfactant-associated protein A-like [Mytilus edulis]|uniref:pulmonary surfactant-associated protein A-like n=1 Tax=Mytilus edulis TaxID=6550 RepID=UPI0039F02275